MGRPGRPTPVIELTDVEQGTLERWVRRHSSGQALALRSRIILGCAAGRTNTEIATTERVKPSTVSKWRHRFDTARLDGLIDAPRPGAQRTIDDATIEAVLVAPPSTTARHQDIGNNTSLQSDRTLGARLPAEESHCEEQTGGAPSGDDQHVGPLERRGQERGLHAPGEVLDREDLGHPRDPRR